MVTIEPIAGKDRAFGAAAGLVAEWRRRRTGNVGGRGAVARAKAEERRWELKLALIGEHHRAEHVVRGRWGGELERVDEQVASLEGERVVAGPDTEGG